MNKLLLMVTFILFSLNAIAASNGVEELDGGVNPGYVDKPAWFKNSFLDIREDLDDATDNNKRLILYFFQDGCPYCEKLIKDNFEDPALVSKTRKYFDLVAINMWGDTEVLSFDGKNTTEKAFAKALRVQYTPTLLMMDEKGNVVLRINGYYHPKKLNVALDYVGQKLENKITFAQYKKTINNSKNKYQINTKHNNVKNSKNLNLSAKNGKPFMVIFESTRCEECLELHNDILNRPESKKLLSEFNVIAVDMWSNKQLFTPSGELTTWSQWAKKLDIKYTPSLVLFDNAGNEVIRTEGYLRSFHIQSVMEYVSSKAYLRQPELQRYIDERADYLRSKGIVVDLMN